MTEPRFKPGDTVSWNGYPGERYKVVKVRPHNFRGRTLFFCDLYYSKGRTYITGVFERALQLVRSKQ